MRNIYFLKMQTGGNAQNYGRYRVLQLLGQGAMGCVYLSEDPILKRQVAVKVIATDRNLDPCVLSEYLKRFAVEAQACAKLNHPSIVSIYDAGEQDGVPWIAFEYVSGEHLDKLIARQKRLPFDRILQIAGDIASAMHHAHAMNIVHRDIKPANILIDEKTLVAKLSDFGVVKAPFTAITQDGVAVGSPGYMSPEQIDNLPVDARSDIFSFGTVLYEMITGTHPFLRDSIRATFFATMGCNFTPVNTLREDTPEKLARIVEKSLVPDANKRISSAEELCMMIGHCLGSASHTVKLPRVKSADIENDAGLSRNTVMRKFKTSIAAIPLLYKRASASAAEFYNKAFFPFAGGVFEKIHAPLRKRFTRSQLAIALTGAISVVAAIVVIMLIAAIGANTGDRKKMLEAAQAKGYDIRGGRPLISIGGAYIGQCNYQGANVVADILLASRNKNNILYGRLFKAMAALCADRFSDASALFLEVEKLKGGRDAIRREYQFYISYLTNWIERELPAALVDLSAQRLYLAEHKQIDAWVKDEHYWKRWNAVRIQRSAGIDVDLVPVYILDLDHSASAQTRIRAVEQLGDIGDRRAVPHLIATRDNRSHPASSTARRVLRETFGVW